MEHIAEQPTVLKDDVNTLAKGSTITFAGKFAGRGIYALAQVVLARLLGPELYGLYAFGWSTLRVVEVLAPLGLDRGVIQFSARSWRTNLAEFKGILLQSFSFAVMAGVVVGAALFLLAPLIETSLDKPGLQVVMRGIALAIPMVTGLRVLGASTHLSRRMQYSVLSEDIAQPIANIVLVVILFAAGLGMMGVMAGTIISFALTLLLTGYYVIRLYPGLLRVKAQQSVSTRAMLAFSIPTAFAGAFTLLTSWTSLLFIGIYLPATEMGIFQAVTQFAILFTITLRALNMVFAPMIAELYQLRQLNRLNELFKISTKWALYLSIPVFLTILFAAEAGLTVVFGAEYASGAVPLVIIAIGQIINVATGSVGFILVMTSHQQIWMNLSLITLIINIGLSWLLIPRLGLNGAAIAASVMTMTLYLGGLWQVRRSLKLWPYDRRYVKILVGLGVSSILLSLLYLADIAIPFIHLILTMGLAAGIFWGMLFAQGLDPEDHDFLRQIRKRALKLVR
jgi:O-antigen/teichoic acid export membrane protein